MTLQRRGLYELLITEALAAELADLDGRLTPLCNDLRSAEAADRIALHLGHIIHRAVASVGDKERVSAGIDLARRLIARIGEIVANADSTPDAPVEAGTVLRAILARMPDGTTETIPEPLIPLLDTTLLTPTRK